MRAYPNRRRGEIAADFNGETRILCLTLGALAELESAFEVNNLTDLTQRFEQGRLSARDIIRVVGAGLRGAGNRVSDEDLAEMSVDHGVVGFATIATELLWVTFGGAQARTDPQLRPETDQHADQVANRQGGANPSASQAAAR